MYEWMFWIFIGGPKLFRWGYVCDAMVCEVQTCPWAQLKCNANLQQNACRV